MSMLNKKAGILFMMILFKVVVERVTVQVAVPAFLKENILMR